MRQPLGMHKAPDGDVVDLQPANLSQLGNQPTQGEVPAAPAPLQKPVPMRTRQCRRLVACEIATNSDPLSGVRP